MGSQHCLKFFSFVFASSCVSRIFSVEVVKGFSIDPPAVNSIWLGAGLDSKVIA